MTKGSDDEPPTRAWPMGSAPRRHPSRSIRPRVLGRRRHPRARRFHARRCHSRSCFGGVPERSRGTATLVTRATTSRATRASVVASTQRRKSAPNTRKKASLTSTTASLATGARTTRAANMVGGTSVATMTDGPNRLAAVGLRDRGRCAIRGGRLCARPYVQRRQQREGQQGRRDQSAHHDGR